MYQQYVLQLFNSIYNKLLSLCTTTFFIDMLFIFAFAFPVAIKFEYVLLSFVWCFGFCLLLLCFSHVLFVSRFILYYLNCHSSVPTNSTNFKPVNLVGLVSFVNWKSIVHVKHHHRISIDWNPFDLYIGHLCLKKGILCLSDQIRLFVAKGFLLQSKWILYTMNDISWWMAVNQM